LTKSDVPAAFDRAHEVATIAPITFAAHADEIVSLADNTDLTLADLERFPIK